MCCSLCIGSSLPCLKTYGCACLFWKYDIMDMFRHLFIFVYLFITVCFNMQRLWINKCPVYC